jgi:hypothetical protein
VFCQETIVDRLGRGLSRPRDRRFQQALNVFPQNVTFQVHPTIGLEAVQIGLIIGEGNDCDGEPLAPIMAVGDGEADAIEGDAAFWHDIGANKLADVVKAKFPGGGGGLG